MNAIHCLLAATLSLAMAAPARAAGPPPEPNADALIKEGIKLRQSGQDEAALDRFKKAFEKSQTARAKAQIGLAEQALGRWLDAAVHVREALAASSDSWIGKNKDALKKALEIAEKHLGRLEVIGGAAGASLKVDGREAATLPAPPIEVVAGQLAIEISAPGYLPIARTVSVPAGGLARESITLVALKDGAKTPAVGSGAAPASSPPPGPGNSTSAGPAGQLTTAPATGASSGTRTAAWIGAAAGGVALGVGVGLYLDVDKKYNACLKSGCAVADQPRTEDTLAVSLIWGGSAVAVVGLAVYFLEPIFHGEPAPSLAGASVLPYLGPSGAGLSGRF